MPIIKCRVAGGAGGRAVAVDISLGVANGAAAVGYLSRAVAAVPGLRPLVRPTHGVRGYRFWVPSWAARRARWPRRRACARRCSQRVSTAVSDLTCVTGEVSPMP